MSFKLIYIVINFTFIGSYFKNMHPLFAFNFKHFVEFKLVAYKNPNIFLLQVKSNLKTYEYINLVRAKIY